MECNHCDKRETCKRICEDVERELSKLGHSLKSHYRVLFYDPATLEIIAHIQHIKCPEIIGRKERVNNRKKRLVILVKRLTKRQRQCTIFYYGLTTGEPMTEMAVAKKLKLHKTTVHQYLKMSLAKLKRLFRESKRTKSPRKFRNI